MKLKPLNFLEYYLSKFIIPISLSIAPLVVAGIASIASSVINNQLNQPGEISVPQRNLSNIAGRGINAVEENIRNALENEERARAGISQIDLRNIGGTLFGGDDNLGSLIQRLSTQSAGQREALDTRARGALLSDVQQFGPGFRDALRDVNPELFNLIGTQEERVLGSLGPSDISQSIASERARRVGRGITGRERSELTENIRSGFSDRGLFRGNRALLEEAISLTEADRNRLIQGEELALASDRDLRSQRLLDDERLGRLIGTRQSTFFDPLSRVGGITSQDALGTGQRFGIAAGLAESGARGLTTAQIFDPQVLDFFNTELNAQLGAGAFGAQIQSAQTTGTSNILGSLGTQLIKQGFED